MKVDRLKAEGGSFLTAFGLQPIHLSSYQFSVNAEPVNGYNPPCPIIILQPPMSFCYSASAEDYSVLFLSSFNGFVILQTW
jgi:hypothetical protein